MTPLALFLALAVAAPTAQIPGVASLSPQGEAGAPLVITGTILMAGNGAPAAGVTMSLYQADVSGIYCDERCPPGTQARLAASLVTGPDGRYEIRTIRPGSYPGQRIPAHIHVKLSCEGCREQVPDEFRFADDPFISDNERSEPERLGRFASVMAVTRGADGTWKATRDIKMTGK
jgi:protocatechuate 3,4-dioxygenase beta subunit